ncbi:hypothetical protein SVAN01_06842 [Stagonosporopsis vannaccii]|nr:hypothetical protein SVAN01_06842 [Stagonosporopsis vannaccii]
MANNNNNNDLTRLAQKLASDGPFRIEHTPRRVRALFNGRYVIDTLQAYHVWEHPNFPQFYVPASALVNAADLRVADAAIEGTSNRAYFGTLTVSNLTTTRVLVFKNAMKDLIKFDFHALDQWFEEDVPVYGHPKDPYKRIDILHSTRNIKVAIDGVTLADSSAPLFLLETTLRTRHYLPPTITHNAAHVSSFSHGSGLLVFINGTLMSASHVALKSNVASLELVKRLPLHELSSIGACLGAAFAEGRSTVEIAWAEVGNETERNWREAERTWEVFPGGPYEAFEMDNFDDQSFLRRCVRRARPLSHYIQNEGMFGSKEMVDGDQPVMDVDDFFDTPSFHSDSCSRGGTTLPFEVRDVTELVSIKQPQEPRDMVTEYDSDEEYVVGLWSPGKGSGPITSSIEVEAMPNQSDIEDDLAWSRAA